MPRSKATLASETVLVLVSGVLDSAMGYLTDHFDDVVSSQAFLNLGKVSLKHSSTTLFATN